MACGGDGGLRERGKLVSRGIKPSSWKVYTSLDIRLGGVIVKTQRPLRSRGRMHTYTHTLTHIYTYAKSTLRKLKTPEKRKQTLSPK